MQHKGSDVHAVKVLLRLQQQTEWLVIVRVASLTWSVCNHSAASPGLSVHRVNTGATNFDKDLSSVPCGDHVVLNIL